MSLKLGAMRISLVILLLVTSGLGNPTPSSLSNNKIVIDTFKNAAFVVHTIR